MTFAAKAQSLVPALVTAAAIGMVWQMFAVNHALGALEANTTTLTELARDHTAQLRDLDRRMGSLDTRMTSLETRMGSMEGQLKALTEAVTRVAPPKP